MAKIAVASSDGVNVNEHFGHAKFFRIYEINESGGELIETRDAVAACQHSFGHDETRFDRIIELISDCDALFVERIGEGAAAYLIEKGVRVFEARATIDALIAAIIKQGIV